VPLSRQFYREDGWGGERGFVLGMGVKKRVHSGPTGSRQAQGGGEEGSERRKEGLGAMQGFTSRKQGQWGGLRGLLRDGAVVPTETRRE